jgi:dihydropteroate synthase
MKLICKDKVLDLTHPVVMGVLNVTPDSFSDGGAFMRPTAALVQAQQMLHAGAAIIDVGGESTRPGAQAVDVQQELDRVIPVIEAITHEFDTIVSIDTSKASVMREAVKAGACLINDVAALRGDAALTTAAALGVPVCLMHMQGEPRTMQQQPYYVDVVAEVKAFLVARRDACINAGIPAGQILFDPGFGFGKDLQHNLILCKHLSEFVGLGQPLMIGVSRKSMLGAILDLPVNERLHGSVALAALAVWQGARIIRAHDVAATVQAIRVIDAVQQA